MPPAPYIRGTTENRALASPHGYPVPFMQDGWLPLHHATVSLASETVMRALLAAYSEGGGEKDPVRDHAG